MQQTIHCLFVKPHYKAKGELKMTTDPMLLLSSMDIENPRWYPIPGGWIITEGLEPHMQEMLKLLEPACFVYLGKHYHRNAIIVQGGFNWGFGRYEGGMDRSFISATLEEIVFGMTNYDPLYDIYLDE